MHCLPIGTLLAEAHIFNLMKATSKDGFGCTNVVTGRNTITLGTAESLAKTGHAGGAKVKVAQHSSATDVEPIGIIRGLLVGSRQLNDINPIRHPYLTSPSA